MSTDEQDVKQIYDEGILEVQKILGSLDSTPEDREIAKESLSNLTALLLAQTIKTIEGRTALLKGLISELNQVIENIAEESPISNQLDGINTIITNATKILDAEKAKSV